MSEAYVCAVCGGEFLSGWTEEEMAAERDHLWAPEIAAGMGGFSEVCDDCFRKFMQWFESESGIPRPFSPPEERTP